MSASTVMVWVAVMVLAVDARAGAIRGELAAASPTTGAKATPASFEDAVVWVDSLPQGTLRHFAGRYRDVRIVQRARQFSPRVTVIAAGTAVRFINRDEVYHNVFSVSPAKRFDVGKIKPRAGERIVFDRPGLVNLFCDIHPEMAAYVVVLPHRAFTRPDAKGRFALPALPAGRYRVRAWHPLLGEATRMVDVPRYGDVQTAIGF